MLHNKMTSRQIFDEIKKDSYIVIPKARQFGRIYNMKYKGFSHTFEHKTTRGNNYKIIYTIEDNSIVFYIITKISTDDGPKYVVMVPRIKENKLESIQIINPHVIHRFRERYHYEDTFVGIVCKILLLMRDIPTLILDEDKNLVDVTEGFTPFKDYNSVMQTDCGLILGEMFLDGTRIDKCAYISTCKTFLPTEMLNKGQRETYDFMTELDKKCRPNRTCDSNAVYISLH